MLTPKLKVKKALDGDKLNNYINTAGTILQGINSIYQTFNRNKLLEKSRKQAIEENINGSPAVTNAQIQEEINNNLTSEDAKASYIDYITVKRKLEQNKDPNLALQRQQQRNQINQYYKYLTDKNIQSGMSDITNTITNLFNKL